MLKIRPSYSKWTIHYTERQVAAEAQEKFRLCRCPPDFYVMNKLLRREMLLRLGLRFRERVCYEDVEYTMRLLGEGGVLVTVPDVVYRYVVNGASITKSRQTPKKQQDKYLAHKAFVAYADARGIRLDARFRRITRRSFGRWGLTWLKIKEFGDRETYRLFDLIPVWRKRVTDKQACDGH
jgi:GT2 family glycosyltransferase